MEKIYTIPVNEAFDGPEGCPLCTLQSLFEEQEVERILGAAMMESDVRIETNRLGFCERHFSMLGRRGKKLPLALMLESHLHEINDGLFRGPVLGGVVKRAEKQAAFLARLDGSCYVCERIAKTMSMMLRTVFYLYKADPAFKDKLKRRTQFCLPHYGALVSGSDALDRKSRESFLETVMEIEKKFLGSLYADVSWFCKKFDYQHADEPWGNSKDSVERTIAALTGRPYAPEKTES